MVETAHLLNDVQGLSVIGDQDNLIVGFGTNCSKKSFKDLEFTRMPSLHLFVTTTTNTYGIDFKLSRDVNVKESPFFNLCPSSASNNPTSQPLRFSTFLLRVSYEMINTGLTTFLPLARDHCCKALTTSFGFVVLPSIAKGVTAPSPSHLTNSLAQFLTKEEGHTTMALSMDFFPLGPCLSKVHIKAIHCKVLPNPISSAMIQPLARGSTNPDTQRYKNLTPST
ncbi:hypothetical protein WICPIJ_007320 [Wickerhamomyces pijperi]|uniref:Uncharacterized protein n=1 Tax=Wickerhamomyces pijperi TaxID=599730 RepID=A0A9P8Q056_WICPI|nr:hypothetical protein WICPIJ_007320 [Wickerhamomyces pijperi]